jgi:hypothetical protein
MRFTYPCGRLAELPKKISQFAALLCFGTGVAHGVTITSSTADLQIHSNGTTAWSGQSTMRIGGASSSYDGAGLFFFALPALDSGESISSASFTVKLNSLANSFDFDADLYGLPYRSTAAFTTGDYYSGTFGGDTGATAIEESFLEDSMSDGITVSSSTSGEEALVEYLNAQYAAGASGGDYVPIRLNIDVSDAANYRYYEVASANDATNAPVLELEIASYIETGTSVTIQGRTYSFGGTYNFVRHTDCDVVAIVSETAVSVTPPSSSLLNSVTADGAMVNPPHEDITSGYQAFDARRPHFDSSRLASGAQSLSVGDVLVGSYSTRQFDATTWSGSNQRKGFTEHYQAIYVIDEAPHPSSLPPPLIDYSGRPTWYATGAIDWEDLAATIPTYSITGFSDRDIEEVIYDLRLNLGVTQDVSTYNGYEEAVPTFWGGPAASNIQYDSNWGGNIIERLNESIACLFSDTYTDAERGRILKAMANNGRQIYETHVAVGSTYYPDGGHHQWEIALIQTYLWATNQMDEYDDLKNTGGLDFFGNYAQAFFVDQDLLDDLQPFGDPDDLEDWASYPGRPWIAHNRRVLAVGTDTVTLQTATANPHYGDGRKSNWTNLMLTDGTDSYKVTADGLPGYIPTGVNSYTLTVPGHTFSTNDVVWFEPEYSLTIGMAEWVIRDIWPQYFIPSSDAAYRAEQRWVPSFLLQFATGQMRPDFEAAFEYAVDATEDDYPLSTNDWPGHIKNGSDADLLYQQYGSTILSITQPYMP